MGGEGEHTGDREEVRGPQRGRSSNGRIQGSEAPHQLHSVTWRRRAVLIQLCTPHDCMSSLCTGAWDEAGGVSAHMVLIKSLGRQSMSSNVTAPLKRTGNGL